MTDVKGDIIGNYFAHDNLISFRETGLSDYLYYAHADLRTQIISSHVSHEVLISDSIRADVQ